MTAGDGTGSGGAVPPDGVEPGGRARAEGGADATATPAVADERAEVRARVGVALAAEAADPVMGALLAEHGAVAVWAALRAGALGDLARTVTVESAVLAARLRRWRERTRDLDPDTVLADAAGLGVRVAVPGSPEWPGQLDDLDTRRPYVLWIRGDGDLRRAALRSVGVVGARAASDYGRHVAGELGYALARLGWTVVSGGAYGVDGAAHQGALAAAGGAGRAGTVAVLPCGVDLSYPRAHERMFAEIVARGTLVTELPPGARPTRRGFLVRNRLIAALTPGTVVVEAGRRSGALNTAAHAAELNRVVMAVPGPVTSVQSVGCHLLLRDCQAVCVTGADDVVEQVGAIGEQVPPPGPVPVVAPERLDDLARRVLAAVVADRGAGPATVAARTGCDLDTVLGQLGLLAAAGFVERVAGGWRACRPPAGG